MRKTVFADLLRLILNQSIFYAVHSKNPKGFYFKGMKKMRKGGFEPEVSLFLEAQFKSKSNLFVDVGAHQGFFSCLANARNVKNTISIEPDLYNYKFLKSNIKMNKFLNKTHLFNFGISNKNGFLEFYGFGTGISAIENWSGSVSKRKFQVPVSTFDDLLFEFLPMKDSVVKIDVEGYELEVLQGATKTLATCDNVAIVIEINNRIENNGKQDTFLEVIEIFHRNHFKMFEFTDKNGNFKEVNYRDLSQVIADLREFQSINYIFLR